MLIDRYAPEDVFARVPELAGQTDPVLKQLDVLLEDDQLFQQVKADLSCSSSISTTGAFSTRKSVWPIAWSDAGSAGSTFAVCLTIPP